MFVNTNTGEYFNPTDTEFVRNTFKYTTSDNSGATLYHLAPNYNKTAFTWQTCSGNTLQETFTPMNWSVGFAETCSETQGSDGNTISAQKGPQLTSTNKNQNLTVNPDLTLETTP